MSLIDRIPLLGLGTWLPKMDGSSKAKLEAVLVAGLRGGIQHIDMAQGFETDGVVVSALRKLEIRRSEVVISVNFSSVNSLQSYVGGLCRDLKYIDVLILGGPPRTEEVPEFVEEVRR